MFENLQRVVKCLSRGAGFSSLVVVLVGGVVAMGSVGMLHAQPPPGPPAGDFDRERYIPYSWFDDRPPTDYDDYYYEGLYEADDSPFDGAATEDYYELYDGPYDDFDVVGEDDEYLGDDYYGEESYDDFGFGGYASQGYGYEGYTYDYYDDAYMGRDVYDDSYDYGVEEDWYYTEDWYEEVGALERWYD